MTGRAGIVHLHLGDGARGLELVRRALDASELPPRVFNPTHVNRRRALFDEAVALAKRGCVVDVTAFPVGEDDDAYSAAEAVARFFASGAPAANLTVSSDAGGCFPCFDGDGRVCRMDVGSSGALLATLRGLLERGLTLADALPPFTTNAARLLRLAAKGSIATGADADLVVLDSDGTPHTVIVQGQIHVADRALVRRGTFEEAVPDGPR
jgi:beta-aspartyl-dipeptidase (metallo-type)